MPAQVLMAILAAMPLKMTPHQGLLSGVNVLLSRRFDVIGQQGDAPTAFGDDQVMSKC